MLKPETYILYLESVVLSLLAERPDPNGDVVSIDWCHPSFENTTFSPYLVRDQIKQQRAARKGESLP